MTTSPHPDRPGRTELGRVLMADGALSSDWAPSYAAVPRSAFLPDLMWPFDMDAGTSVAVSRTETPRAWFEYADSDVPVVTQWDDGTHTGTTPGRVPTSSASMPSVVFRMLQDLNVHPSNRVLEIGTGTGWNTALLAHRLRAENVVTVEVDDTVARRARARLERFGRPVQVVHGDGYEGHPATAPYDRIIATAGVRHIPLAWIEQTRPTGLIVAPWGTHHSNDDAVARLVVARDGASASGHFTGPVEFMKLRTQRLPSVVHGDYVKGGPAERVESWTGITQQAFLGGRFSPQRFALGLRVPNCHSVVAEQRGGATPVWFYGLTDRSWACVLFRDGTPARVWQAGPRRLWEEVETAHRWWENEGRPGHERFGLTVTASAQYAWLDTPDHPWKIPHPE